MDSTYIIKALGLERHPEGGYYRENYRSSESISKKALPERFSGSRNFSTAIYFLLPENEISALHRIKADELWHFYDGDPYELTVIYPGGVSEKIMIGRDLTLGHQPQYAVKAGCWFGGRKGRGEKGYTLLGCTVAPGFDFADFELANRQQLTALYPRNAALIAELTRL